jgi:alanine racemase
MEAARSIIHAVEQAGILTKVHLKVDSGLHRYGAMPSLASSMASELDRHHLINLEGIYSHYSSSDELNSSATDYQLQILTEAVEDMREAGTGARYIHLPNSAAILTGMIGPSNLVRAGIASYGLAPSPEVPLPEGMMPVMSVRGALTRVFTLEAGEGVSYGLTYRAVAAETAATVPIGYADGLPRSLSNKGWFAIDGRRAEILGRVCMDQTVVRAPEGTTMSSSVQIVGETSTGAMTVDDVATIDGTINYEIATRLSARMPRIYVEDGEAIGLDLPVVLS